MVAQVRKSSKVQKPIEIQSAVIYHCTEKATGQVFYMVKSDTQDGVYYRVDYRHEALQWQCSCKATKPCKHEKAVNSVLKAKLEIGKVNKPRREQEAKQAQEQAPTYHKVPANDQELLVQALEEARDAELSHGTLKRASELKAEIEARKASPVAAKVQEARNIHDGLKPSEKGVLNGHPRKVSFAERIGLV
jgi:uncharacterized membrane protein